MTSRSTRFNPPVADFQISLANEQAQYVINESQLMEAARAVLRDSRFSSASISIAIVDDACMQQLNRQYLDHDWPTDVLSFVLDEAPERLEGEVIVSADTAAREAEQQQWAQAAEQLLYVIHGMLHLVGYRDKSPSEVEQMRKAEAKYLLEFGFAAPAGAQNEPTGSPVQDHRPRKGGTLPT